MKLFNPGNSQIFSGTKPVNTLCDTSIASTLSKPAKLLGKIPVNELDETSNTVRFLSIPISTGKQPERSFPPNAISFNLPILPILLGIHPVKLLFEKTTTDTVELPRFSGIVPVKRLLFRNKASSSLLKSPVGKEPSKSLYLISRNLSSGNPTSTSGNCPTNLLLLISSS